MDAKLVINAHQTTVAGELQNEPNRQFGIRGERFFIEAVTSDDREN